MEKVAAYIRVSTASEAQTHSYGYQESYWRDILNNKSNVKMVGIYADLGISGRSMSKRPQFMAMIEDCRCKLIDRIYVKSVSRFSRNTVELLAMVRQLRELNVSVFFEQEQIDTLRSTSDLELTIAVAIAEADLQRYSENQRWSIAHKFSKGIIAIGNKIYGYEMSKDNDLIKVPHEAEIVADIFDYYSRGWSINKIAKHLSDNGIKTVRGKTEWQTSTIGKMLRNERYKGDSIQHKFVNINGVKHDNSNGAIRNQLYIKDSHEGIVSREQFDQVQEMLTQRANPKLIGQVVKVRELTGEIVCGNCGKKYIHKINNSGLPCASEQWDCSTKLKKSAKVCGNSGIKDKVVKEKFIEAFNQYVQGGYDNEHEERAMQTRATLIEEESALRAMYANGYLQRDHYKQAVGDIIKKINEQEMILQKYKIKNVGEKDYQPITDFEYIKYDKFIVGIVINSYNITFKFINEVEITLPYTNGKPGNIKDWVNKNRRKQ